MRKLVLSTLASLTIAFAMVASSGSVQAGKRDGLNAVLCIGAAMSKDPALRELCADVLEEEEYQRDWRWYCHEYPWRCNGYDRPHRHWHRDR